MRKNQPSVPATTTALRALIEEDVARLDEHVSFLALLEAYEKWSVCDERHHDDCQCGIGALPPDAPLMPR